MTPPDAPGPARIRVTPTRRRPPHRLIAASVAVAALAACAACAATGSVADAPHSLDVSAGGTSLEGELTVMAAASLHGAFDELAQIFADEHPGVHVAPVVYDGSSTLVTQLTEGAVADVVALADTRTMASVSAAGLVEGEPAVFASNTLQIAVAPGNPADVADLADLAEGTSLQVVVCASQVPCGAAAATALAAADVDLGAVSEEQNVTSVLTKVAAGEADAGLVYATDVRGADGTVDGVDFPEASRAVNSYPVAALADAPEPELAQEFVDLVLSARGQQVLAGYGFGPP